MESRGRHNLKKPCVQQITFIMNEKKVPAEHITVVSLRHMIAGES